MRRPSRSPGASRFMSSPTRWRAGWWRGPASRARFAGNGPGKPQERPLALRRYSRSLDPLKPLLGLPTASGLLDPPALGEGLSAGDVRLEHGAAIRPRELGEGEAAIEGAADRRAAVVDRAAPGPIDLGEIDAIPIGLVGDHQARAAGQRIEHRLRQVERRIVAALGMQRDRIVLAAEPGAGRALRQDRRRLDPGRDRGRRAAVDDNGQRIPSREEAMDLLVFLIIVLACVGIVCAIAYQIPFPPPVSWLRWVIPCLALLVGLVVILGRIGPTY